ncbi:hypothetical protein LA329_10885 [Corynebacterium falsenii]|uniref:hypothetical protein n=1 Tax=Corynebacterium falsenii TaxID=108486 RepID=UPI001CCB57CC|nr:hypothetical protein [Corynebacterium falsenii]UBI06723.1 hypothetical protein LA329_10885 [Corynebacterium falsenii]
MTPKVPDLSRRRGTWPAPDHGADSAEFTASNTPDARHNNDELRGILAETNSRNTRVAFKYNRVLEKGSREQNTPQRILIEEALEKILE